MQRHLKNLVEYVPVEECQIFSPISHGRAQYTERTFVYERRPFRVVSHFCEYEPAVHSVYTLGEFSPELLMEICGPESFDKDQFSMACQAEAAILAAQSILKASLR